MSIDASENLHLVFIQKRGSKAGAQVALVRLAKELIQRIESVTLITSAAKDEWLTQKCNQIGVKVIRIKNRSARSIFSKLIWNNIEIKKICTELAGLQGRIVIHANDYTESLTASLIAEKLGVFFFTSLRSSGMLKNDFIKYNCLKSRSLIVPSKRYLNYFQSYSKSALFIEIPDPISDDYFEESWPGVGTVKRLNILVIGGDHPDKGTFEFLNALEGLEIEGNNLRFNILGKKLERYGPILDHLISKDGVELRFLGRVNDLRNIMICSDLVVNVSRRETFGLAVIEALALGVPVCSSRVGVIDEFLPEEFTYDPGNSSEIKNVLQSILRKDQLETWNSKYFKEYIREKYSVSLVVDSYLKLIIDSFSSSNKELFCQQ